MLLGPTGIDSSPFSAIPSVRRVKVLWGCHLPCSKGTGRDRESFSSRGLSRRRPWRDARLFLCVSTHKMENEKTFLGSSPESSGQFTTDRLSLPEARNRLRGRCGSWRCQAVEPPRPCGRRSLSPARMPSRRPGAQHRAPSLTLQCSRAVGTAPGSTTRQIAEFSRGRARQASCVLPHFESSITRLPDR